MTLPRPHWGWASLPCLLLVWIALASRFPSYVLPPPWTVAAEAWRWLQDGSLWLQFRASALEELAGFGAAVVVAVLLGTAAGLSRHFRDFVAPLNSLFMAIPPIAWAPLILIIFGLGFFSIVLVIFIAAVFPMAVTIQEGVLGIRDGEVRAARTLGASHWQLLGYVYLPASLPFLTAALRIGFSQGWRALVAAEMIGASQGIGWMVSMGGQIGNASQVLLGISLIGLLAWLMESLVFRRLERHYQAWRAA
ncbi:ABC transporter permease [Pseudomonas oryzihabitans]|uniref:ABC-type nitrate/sulfonate/bicarbonate transport system permease component n=1 Tax=Pseudomonas oryzihabitans TaxID=47885 RepID=A0AAJ2BHI4_9PSED|nr:ABC transporter permease [Pseudomonas psychrotolerans]MDR6232892.1 ABC-type nitrate/sulfonate/bicarbonate transport system permease component [Pseudomonas psychrotolerans]MDR6358152.1 ABC-type nitrate/sulfonate/bicarbonate transport system permease component [Pseudomonas psychrotolerans]